MILGGCVKLSEGSADVFSKMLLLFSLTNSWTNRDEVDFSQIMYGSNYVRWNVLCAEVSMKELGIGGRK